MLIIKYILRILNLLFVYLLQYLFNIKNFYKHYFFKKYITKDIKNIQVNSIIQFIKSNTSYIYLLKNDNKCYILKISDDTKYINKLLISNEIYFYKNVNNQFMPKLIANFNENGIILEYLNNNITKHNFFMIIKKIIKMHNSLNYIKKNINYNYCLKTLEEIKKVVNQYSFILLFYDKINYNRIKKLLEDNLHLKIKGKTLIHGDMKIDNILINLKHIYFIDWSFYRLGYGLEDILSLLIFSLKNNLFILKYDKLLNFYILNIKKKYNSKILKKNIIDSLKGILLYQVIGLLINNIYRKNNNIDFYYNYLYLINYYDIR